MNRPSGVELARQAGATSHADLIDQLKEQLLIVFLKELKARGHNLVFPLSQVDDTGNDLLSFAVVQNVARPQDQSEFHFHITRKS